MYFRDHCIYVTSFKRLYSQLRDLKSEIEHVQHLLQKAKLQLQRDFEQWWTTLATEGKVSLVDNCGHSIFQDYLTFLTDNKNYKKQSSLQDSRMNI